MTEAYVTGTVIEWARERARVSVEDIASAMGVKAAQFVAWEEGTARPTLRQAEDMANRLHVPFGYLFLSDPPKEAVPLPDLRTIANRPLTDPSPELVEVTQDALRKQDWYREYLETEEAAPLPFVGRFSADDKATMIAEDIRGVLGIDGNLRKAAHTWEDFIDLLARQAEGAGILVLRSSYVGSNTRRLLDKDEFRGFALVDGLAPLIFINAADWKSAQIFTIAHELAHVWIGEPGVSNLDYELRSSGQRVVVDRVCDQIAAETLTPALEFRAAWDVGTDTGWNLARLATSFKVSQFVILRRARENDLISDNEYWAYRDELGTRDRPPKPSGKKRGGDFYRSLPIRNSRTFTATILSAVRTGAVTYRTAARLLSVSPPVLPTAYQKLLEGGL